VFNYSAEKNRKNCELHGKDKIDEDWVIKRQVCK